MKKQLTASLDRFVPAGFHERRHSEELIRARSLVFIVVANLLVSVGLLLAALFSGSTPAGLRGISTATLPVCVLGNLLALWVFARYGFYALAANLMTAATYSATMVTVIWAREPQFAYLLVVLYAAPVIVSCVANQVSVMFWWLVVLVSPAIVAVFGNPLINNLFLACWMVGCASMGFGLHMEQFYRKSMRTRLQSEISRSEFAAAHDPLTGLANRSSFDERLEECIAFSREHGSRALVLMIDLNEFKPINDTYGHQAGDAVLTIIARRLHRLLRSSDMVARFGGDEFALLVEGGEWDSVDSIVQRIAAVIRQPLAYQGTTLEVSSSIGVAVCPEDSIEAGELLRIADERMYVHKRRSQIRAV